MPAIREVLEVLTARPTLEGAGVHLRRAFGFDEVPLFDPFLLLDDFRGDDPVLYEMGFPWHPHRGIETVTIMLDGSVEHGDSLGNRGQIGPGDVQWMTAGSGIIHQEMPKGNDDGVMGGFQLWVNLPAADKMIPPCYREVGADSIPVAQLEGGVRTRVIAGQLGSIEGPVTGIVTGPLLFDLSLPAGSRALLPVAAGLNAFAYVCDGAAGFGTEHDVGALEGSGSVVRFGDGESVQAVTRDRPARFLLAAGRPIGEPVAWRGPVVMNNAAEIETAFREYREGRFLKN